MASFHLMSLPFSLWFGTGQFLVVFDYFGREFDFDRGTRVYGEACQGGEFLGAD
jgi:hypothetical protein